jgi:hypothetical protein
MLMLKQKARALEYVGRLGEKGRERLQRMLG